MALFGNWFILEKNHGVSKIIKNKKSWRGLGISVFAWPWNFQGMQPNFVEFSGVDAALLCLEFPRGKVKKHLMPGGLQRHVFNSCCSHICKLFEHLQIII